MTRILLLGGTTEALAIARTLEADHIYSLAGLGKVPQDLKCAVRVGGFGGAQGLADFIAAQAIDLLLDATHPYAGHYAALVGRQGQGTTGVLSMTGLRWHRHSSRFSARFSPWDGNHWHTLIPFLQRSSGPYVVSNRSQAMRDAT